MKTVLYYVYSILVFLMLTSIAYSQTTWHVDDDAPPPGNGTPENPFPCIKDGVSAAEDGDIVMVHDGTYTGECNVDVRPGEAITITSENGPDNTIIDCAGTTKRAFSFTLGEGSDTVVDGFTITGGGKGFIITGISVDEINNGGGIACAGSSPTIINNIITGNSAPNNGGGIFCTNSSPIIKNNIIIGNTALNNGGGIMCDTNSNPEIINNIIAGNYARVQCGGIFCHKSSPMIIYNTITGNWTEPGDTKGGGIVSYNGSAPTVLNSILWENTPKEIIVSGASITITYSDIREGWAGQGNINADPLFVDPGNDNYYLQAGSLCLSSASCQGGIPTDIDGQPRPLGSGCDMGAYEQCDGGLIYGDVSWNCIVTAFDASLVLQYVIGSIHNLSKGQLQVADVTNNGIISALDAALILQYTVGLITKFPAESGSGAPILNAKSESKLLSDAISTLEKISLDREQKEVVKQLKHLLVSSTLPTHTALLQNYPNPFNPETWLPYKLAQDAHVTIRIYNAKGQLVRSLQLSMKQVGSYITKDRAAYWDGRDNLGQKVASGVYFYTLLAGKYIETRRMVILK